LINYAAAKYASYMRSTTQLPWVWFHGQLGPNPT